MGSPGGLQDRADPTLPGWHLPYWCGSMPSPTRLKTVTLALWSDHCAVRHPSDRLGNQAIPPTNHDVPQVLRAAREPRRPELTLQLDLTAQ